MDWSGETGESDERMESGNIMVVICSGNTGESGYRGGSGEADKFQKACELKKSDGTGEQVKQKKHTNQVNRVKQVKQVNY